MFKRIVVGYAGDRAGRDGVLFASQIAEMCGAALTVAFPYHPLLAELPGDVAEQRVREDLHVLLGPDPALERARFYWSNASWPIRALHELAQFDEADLIVFGAAPERLGRRHIDLMDRMVHGAPCAIAVVPDRYVERKGSAIRRVGVGFTDSPDARAAVLLADELAALTREPLEIVSGSGLSGVLAGYAVMSAALPEVEREMYEQAQANAQRIAAELNRPVSVDVQSGDPARALIQVSQTLDLLVLGSRGYGPIRHVLLGSVSAEVMRKASCPVLILPRQVHREAAAPATDRALLGR